MSIKHHHPKARTAARTLAALALLTVGSSPIFTSAAHAVDPYDQNLEKRIEALERELDVMENDSKGKNVEQTDEVPTFLRAAGTNVQQLTISGDLRFRYNYDNENYPVSRRRATNSAAQPLSLPPAAELELYPAAITSSLAVGVSTLMASPIRRTRTITEGFDDYGIYLHQFIVGWKPTDWGTIIVGKLFAPFYDNEDAIVDFERHQPDGRDGEAERFPISQHAQHRGELRSIPFL